MFEVGEKVVCVDDQFNSVIVEQYSQLPVKDHTYTVRDCEPGRGQWLTKGDKGWGSVDMKVLLVELVNPLDPTTKFGCPSELGFAARRFRPLQEIHGQMVNKNSKKDLVPA